VDGFFPAVGLFAIAMWAYSEGIISDIPLSSAVLTFGIIGGFILWLRADSHDKAKELYYG
jgi:hypothetical protein